MENIIFGRSGLVFTTISLLFCYVKGSDLVAHVTRVKYFTKDKEKFINPDNLKKYKKYLQSNIIKN